MTKHLRTTVSSEMLLKSAVTSKWFDASSVKMGGRISQRCHLISLQSHPLYYCFKIFASNFLRISPFVRWKFHFNKFLKLGCNSPSLHFQLEDSDRHVKENFHSYTEIFSTTTSFLELSIESLCIMSNVHINNFDFTS